MIFNLVLSLPLAHFLMHEGASRERRPIRLLSTLISLPSTVTFVLQCLSPRARWDPQLPLSLFQRQLALRS